MTTTTLTSANRAILAADDDNDDLTLLRLLLRKAGVDHPLQLCRDGEAVMATLSALLTNPGKVLRPLLCFLDLRLSALGISGLEVLKWIRAQPALNDMPVVMLTDSENPRDVMTAAKNGAQCYLTKYPQPALLRQVIDEAERFALGAPVDEGFRLPANQLLVRGRRLSDRR